MIETKKITAAEFWQFLTDNDKIILKANGAAVIKPLERDSVKTGEKKKNTLKDGTLFGVCARSRFSANLSQYAMNYDGNFGFVTLTFPPCNYDGNYNPELFDSVLVSCCQRYFKRLTKENRINAFAWVAERHNGNDKKHKKTQGLHKNFLHFHCFVFFNGFQSVQEMNKIFLDVIQGSNNLMGFQIINQDGKFYASVDIDYFQGCNEISKMMVYVKKYCTKDAEIGKVYARRWGWSRSLSGLKAEKVITVKELKEILDSCEPIQIQKYTRFYDVCSMQDDEIDETTGEIKQKIGFRTFTASLPYHVLNLPVFQQYFKF